MLSLFWVYVHARACIFLFFDMCSSYSFHRDSLMSSHIHTYQTSRLHSIVGVYYVIYCSLENTVVFQVLMCVGELISNITCLRIRI